MKKLIALLLTLCMACSVVACGSKEAETAAPEAAETEAAEEAEVTGEATGEPIVVGAFLALTGANAQGGINSHNGVQIAFDYVNENGGINGRPLELLCYDDASTPEGAVKTVTRLIEQDEVPVMIGSHLSPNLVAAMDPIEEAGVPMIGCGTGLGFTNCGNEYIFRGTLSPYSSYPTVIEMLLEVGDMNVAFFYSETDLGQGAREWFINTGFPEAGITPVIEVSYQKSETDYTGHIAKALAENPDAIVIPNSSGAETAQFIKQLRQQGFKGIVYTTEAGSSAIIVETAEELADGMVYAAAALNTATVEESLTEEVAFVQQRYLDKYGEMPANDGVFRGWDSGMIVAEALKQVDDVNDPEAIRDAILNITDYKGVQGTFDFSDGTGDGLSGLGKYMVMGQKNVLYDLDELKEWKAAQ